MADQKAQRSQQGKQSQPDAAGSAGGDTQNAGSRGTAASTGNVGNLGSAPRGEQRSDREREREVSREGSRAAGTGMQRGAAQGGRNAMIGGQQGHQSILPALLANPDLMTRAIMANPFSFAQAMSQEMDRLFSMEGGALSSPVGQAGGRAQSNRGPSQWAPPLEVLQRENELVVRADLPGLKPDDIQIDVEDHVLTISGERHERSEDRQNGFYRTERSYGSFSRSIALPEGVDEDQVNAHFEHGVLEVTVPLPQQRQRGRRIQVQSGASATSGQQGQSSQRAVSGSASNAGQSAGKNAGQSKAQGAKSAGRGGPDEAAVRETQGSE